MTAGFVRHYLVIALLTMLSACAATSVGYTEMIDSWIGKPESDLFRSWGSPTQVYDVGARRVVVYVSQRDIHVPGSPPMSISSGGTYMWTIEGSPGWTIKVSCTTTFELADSVVVSGSFKGDDCRPRA